MENNIISSLNLITTSDRDKFLEVLDRLISQIYSKENENILEVLKRNIPVDLFELISKNLNPNETTSNHTQITHQLESLRDFLRKLPKIQVTIATAPSVSDLELITKSIRNKFGHDCLIQLTIDPEIVGGIIISKEGKYMDLSLKSVIDQTIAQHIAQ